MLDTASMCSDEAMAGRQEHTEMPSVEEAAASIRDGRMSAVDLVEPSWPPSRSATWS